MPPITDDELRAAAVRCRLRVVDTAKRAGVGHIGSALSVMDIVTVLQCAIMNAPDAGDPTRDRLVLSKGHAAMALYAALVETGCLDEESLASYCTDGSTLATHPERVVPGIDFCSGSLGQGLSVGTGSALAARIGGQARRTFVLMSDAECDAGATWEAALFAGHHRLNGLTAIIDVNGQQALGYTPDVLDLEPLDAKWKSFGWDVIDADGHSISALRNALEFRGDRPTVILARTKLGRGVSFMEGLIKWHYWPLSDEEHVVAATEISAGLA